MKEQKKSLKKEILMTRRIWQDLLRLFIENNFITKDYLYTKSYGKKWFFNCIIKISLGLKKLKIEKVIYTTPKMP